MVHAARQRRHVEEQQLDEAEKLRRREIYKRNEQAADEEMATNWMDDGYSNNAYADECLKHHNYHRANHAAPEIQWDPYLAYIAQLVASSCVYGHNLDYDSQAGQNIAGGMAATNISGTITELWYNGELPYFSEMYGQPYPDMTYFEQYGHMTQIVWKGTAAVGCATQYCPYGLANAGSVEPYFTVCNYKDPGNVFGYYDQMVSPPQGAPDIHWDMYKK